MKNNHNSPMYKRQGKDSKFIAQIKVVFDAFQKEPKTMLQVSTETNILRANICRYVAMFLKQDKIQHFKKGYCPISKHRAGFYTTNKELFVKTNIQFELFSDEN